MFTVNEHLVKWLTMKSDVEPEVGGKYELFWTPEDPENNSTIGCKVLEIDEPYLINFEWKGPVQYKIFMNYSDPLTNVTVTFHQIDNKTQVTLIHTGWQSELDWEEARLYFSKAWEGAFKNLIDYVNQ